MWTKLIQSLSEAVRVSEFGGYVHDRHRPQLRLAALTTEAWTWPIWTLCPALLGTQSSAGFKRLTRDSVRCSQQTLTTLASQAWLASSHHLSPPTTRWWSVDSSSTWDMLPQFWRHDCKVDHWPVILECPGAHVDTLMFERGFIMDSRWWAQKSNKKTALGSDQRGQHSFQSLLQVSVVAHMNEVCHQNSEGPGRSASFRHSNKRHI